MPNFRRTRIAAPMAGVLLVLGLAACSSHDPTAPFLYGEENGARIHDDQYDKVMVCYNAQWTEPEAVRAKAAEGCGRVGRVPRFVSQDVLACPVFLPMRAHFVCEEPPKRPAPPRAVAPSAPPAPDPDLPPELPEHLRN